ncbi:sorting nexin-31 isoform X2 [Ranitomeya imitator]|uniref:sorting nexin-31 isoform X2 n=1 Tax=Ranitomeya imitator TaxID=111125 RepID=UPI0037E78D5B
MHVCIPITENLVDNLGGNYVMRDIFKNQIPTFPPKYYLAMTSKMAEERRVLLKQYLQEVFSDPVVSNSDVFITGVQKLQMDTFQMPPTDVILKVYLPNGRLVNVESKTSDIAERVLESHVQVVHTFSYPRPYDECGQPYANSGALQGPQNAALHKISLSRELVEFFGLFITHKDPNNIFSVVKRVVPFEIPFLTIWNVNNEAFQIDIRKWYMSPSNDAMLMGCSVAVDILYAQAVQEFGMNWCRPTEQQKTALQELLKTNDKFKILAFMQQIEHYSYQRMDPSVSDYQDANTMVTISVGKDELYCSFKISDRTEIMNLHISKISAWDVLLHQPEKDRDQQELKLEYMDENVLKWITIWTNQGFLISTWLKKMVSEQQVVSTKENLEIEDNGTSANSSRKQKKDDGHTKQGSTSS